MTYGLFKRKVRSTHIKVMFGAIIWDILLILQIELSRSAIKKASGLGDNHTALLIHLFFAVSTVLLYGVMIYSGRRILKGDTSIRKWHKIGGITTYVFRWLTLLTSYYAVLKTGTM
jgi:hypothetical protein